MYGGAPKMAQDFFSGAIIWVSVNPTEENILLLNNIDINNWGLGDDIDSDNGAKYNNDNGDDSNDGSGGDSDNNKDNNNKNVKEQSGLHQVIKYFDLCIVLNILKSFLNVCYVKKIWLIYSRGKFGCEVTSLHGGR